MVVGCFNFWLTTRSHTHTELNPSFMRLRERVLAKDLDLQVVVVGGDVVVVVVDVATMVAVAVMTAEEVDRRRPWTWAFEGHADAKLAP